MALFCGSKSSAAALAVIKDFKTKCLINSGSLFTDKSIWQTEFIDELIIYYVENLDSGSGNFLSKLESQLAKASPEVKILAAEMLWLMLLCPSNISVESKRTTIATVFQWSELPYSSSAEQNYLSDDVLYGIGSAGVGYNTFRWRELVYFIRLIKAFFELSFEQRSQLLSNHQDFSSWLEQIPENEQRQLRHMLLYLFFPQYHERIFGNIDRKNILLALTSISRKQFKAMKAREVDLELHRLRQDFENEFNTKEIDYYVAPLRALWKGDKA